jgi:hypothetical protein
MSFITNCNPKRLRAPGLISKMLTRMTSVRSPSHARLGVAVIIAGLIIAAGIFISAYVGTATTTTLTSTTTVNVTSTVASSNVELYELTFQQIGIECCAISGCPSDYIMPWGVALWNNLVGNLTLTSPPNSTIPTYGYEANPNYKNFSAITFTVPIGTYSYRVITGAGDIFGQATVPASDWTVQVSIPATCGQQ